MSDENAKLIAKIVALKEKLEKNEKQNAELMIQDNEMKEQNKELKEQNVALLEIIRKLEAEKLKNEQTNSNASNANPVSEKMFEGKTTYLDLEEKMNAKLAERKSVPNWLIEVLAWIKRMEMADSKLSTSNWTFKQLCWPKLHLNKKPYNVKSLKFCAERNESTVIYQAKLTILRRGFVDNDIPIACIPPPEYIIGFNYVSINILEGRIMKFIECILPKLHEISLEISHAKIPSWYSVEQFGQIHRLFEMLAKKAASITSKNIFDFLRVNTNGFGLIENVQSICAEVHKFNIDLLVEWLDKSRSDRKPKIFEFYSTKEAESIFNDQIKEQFIGSTQSANFIISFVETDYPIFNLENEQTGEVLALYSRANQDQWDDGPKFLVRHPKGEEHLRADWENQIKSAKSPYILVDIYQGIGEF